MEDIGEDEKTALFTMLRAKLVFRPEGRLTAAETRRLSGCENGLSRCWKEYRKCDIQIIVRRCFYSCGQWNCSRLYRHELSLENVRKP